MHRVIWDCIVAMLRCAYAWQLHSKDMSRKYQCEESTRGNEGNSDHHDGDTWASHGRIEDMGMVEMS